MNFLILGNGPEEQAWARAIGARPEHQLWAAYPGFDESADAASPHDFDEALATRGVDAVIVGGDLSVRGEWLRRVAGVGLPAICLHPPGDDSEAYYQVALTPSETGAVIVPDLPLRRHPGVEALRRALEHNELGTFRGIRHESSVDADGGDLVRHAFARVVDVVRAVLGEVEAVTATGDPPGDHPQEGLVVQLRGPHSRRAEIRIDSGPAEAARLVVSGEQGMLTLEYDARFNAPARLVARSASTGETASDLEAFDPHGAILDVLAASIAGREAHPNLIDGTRAMELSEATARSLRRGRTIDLHYEQVSEVGSFKSVMTSTGCVLLLGTLVALPAALVGPVFGLGWTLYIAYAIPPLLIVFILLQTLRFAVRGGDDSSRQTDPTGQE
jgi:myo-inositol 2-dehydrogenase/D-chiro-inositol 1-dehydrogenase